MPYTTPATVRATYPVLGDLSTYSDQLLTDLIAEFEAIAENYRGVAYITRTTTETPLLGASAIVLRWPKVQAVSAFTGNAVTISSYTLDTDSGLITDFTADAPISVTYTHGFTAVPAIVLRACKIYVRNAAKADTSGTSRDVLSQSDGQGASTRYATPDWSAGRPTGYLEVDRLLNSMSDYRPLAFA